VRSGYDGDPPRPPPLPPEGVGGRILLHPPQDEGGDLEEAMTEDQELDFWLRMKMLYGSDYATQITVALRKLPLDRAERCLDKALSNLLRNRQLSALERL
jgi:hypothetical protein